MFFQNRIWSTLLDINRLCLVCIKRSIEEVKKCQISKRSYQQVPSDGKLKKARYQYCDDKFGHLIMEVHIACLVIHKENSTVSKTERFCIQQNNVWYPHEILLLYCAFPKSCKTSQYCVQQQTWFTKCHEELLRISPLWCIFHTCVNDLVIHLRE